MRTRRGSKSGQVTMTEGSQRELRPRPSPGFQLAPPGGTAPSAAGVGRVTRRSARYGANPGPQSPPHGGPPPSPSPLPRRPKPSVTPKRPAPRSTGARQSKRTRPQSGFYEEDDSDMDDLANDEEEDIDSDDTPLTTVLAHRTPRTHRTPARRILAPSSTKKSATKKSPTKKVSTGPTTSQSAPRQPEPPKNEIIPDWTRIPYLLWVKILREASDPLDDREKIDWLVAASRTSSLLAEPALNVLYYRPPLLTRPMAHNLAALLAKDPSTTTFNYRVKVKKLDIEVGEIASKTHRGHTLDLVSMVRNLPQLQVINFHHTKDLPPFRQLDENLRWHYPDSLFDALNGIPPPADPTAPTAVTKLAAWRWNRRMLGDLTFARIKSLHMSPAFSGLKKLSFVNCQVPSLHMRGSVDDAEIQDQDTAFVRALADAISALPSLTYLSAETSTAVNSELLSLLPKTLKTLELVNCWEVSGEDLAAYLLTHGRNLEHLYLQHNQSLNLKFLPILGRACPKFKTLSMDFKYFKHHEFYSDGDPNYQEVLEVDEIPNWPASLERLELKNMRQLSAEAAEMLFQSLVDSAPNLPNLRHIDLKTMLDIPFRRRSTLRDKWVAKLKEVFLRDQTDPKPFTTLRPVGTTPQAAQEVDDSPATTTNDNIPRGKKRKARASGLSEGETRRSRRIATQNSNPSSSRESSSGRDLTPESEASGASERAFRQSLCATVEVQLDNQKPIERTFGMEDFLDDDRGSDDAEDSDWDGDVDVDTGYAW
ncbi:F-box protein At-B [Podospora conica]|nr:F-box protein At-B [Schizothecium conicum]